MRIVAKAPCRVDLAGGTLDIWPLYLHHPNAVTVNFAIDCYTSCEIETGPESIRLHSLDQGKQEEFGSLEGLRRARKPRLPLLARYAGVAASLAVRLERYAEADVFFG